MLAHGPSLRLLPYLDDDNRFFWTSGEDGHPPGPVCRNCLSRDQAPQIMSGRGRVETFSINYQQWIPGSEPYVIAWVSLEEQPSVRLSTNLIGVEAEDVRIGMEVAVEFEGVEDVFIPLFRPVAARDAS
jgi:uncharacterized OB-fold protein